MAMKMVDTLSEEMEAVVAAGGVPEVVAPVQTPLVGISLPGVNKPPGACTGKLSHSKLHKYSTPSFLHSNLHSTTFVSLQRRHRRVVK